MRLVFFFLSLALLLASSLNVSATELSDSYQLQPGDSVFVSVWREEALQKEVKVLPDGAITFPLAGRVDVGGKAIQEAEKLIGEKLKEYIPDPIVSLVVTNIEGNRVFVLGKVGKPGPVVMSGELTVLQALSVAGGLDKFADEGAIKLIRNNGKQQEVLPVSYRELISGRNLATNLRLKAGDTIIVP